MLAVLSPAKNLDMDSPAPVDDVTQPRFMDEATGLAKTGASLPVADIQRLMKLSDNLAAKTSARFKAFNPPLTLQNAKASFFAFNGDVYQGLAAHSLEKEALEHAQKHIRILSGLYGVLRPLDLMAPYRLEMGTRFKTAKAPDLYRFWDDKIAHSLKADMEKANADILVNLASQEYAKAIDKKALDAPILTIDFREIRDGKAKMISFFAKKARGLMARFIAENQLTDPEDLKAFDIDGYRFAPALSDQRIWTFLRPDSRG